jgi:protein-tyrosine phosphatase
MVFFNRSVYLVDFLDGITDIHNHILPAIDDGSPNLDTSLKMIKSMKALGIKNCIATPHIMEDYYGNNAGNIRANFIKTNKALETTEGKGFIIGAASEYMMDGQLDQIIETETYLCLYKNYILTELSYFQRRDNLEELVFKMCQKNLIPILAHPERYRYIKSIEAYKDLKNRGFELQLNLLSLTNHYGEDVLKKAKSLLEKDLFEFIGTDAHQLTHLEKIKEIKIKKKQIPSIKKLVENHKLVFDL